MSEPFTASYQVAWADLDANAHMRNTRYLDYASQTRFLYLASAGFPPPAFRKANVGPAIFRDEVTYKRELRHLARFTVELRLAAQSGDGSQYVFAETFLHEDGVVAAEVRTHAAWFDLSARKVVAPPPQLKAAMDALAHTGDYEERSRSLPSRS